MNIGAKIKYLREKNDMSQKQLSEKAKINTSVMNRIESGERPIRDDELVIFSKIFEVSTDYILGLTDEINNNAKSNKIDINKNNNDNDIEKMIDELMEQKGLMLCGEPMSEEDMFLLRNSIRSTIELAKTMKGNKK